MSVQTELSGNKHIISEFSRGCSKIATDILELMKVFQFGYKDTKQHHI